MQQTDLENPINCPTIFSSTMTIEKAKHIMALVSNSILSEFGFEEYGVTQFPKQYSLEEICIASRVMNANKKVELANLKEGETLSSQLSVEDRGIALHYAIAHFGYRSKDVFNCLNLVSEKSVKTYYYMIPGIGSKVHSVTVDDDMEIGQVAEVAAADADSKPWGELIKFPTVINLYEEEEGERIAAISVNKSFEGFTPIFEADL